MGSKARASWSTKLGFYLAAIGTPCGLGNIWRFPYVVGENGGGAFVLLYILMMLAVGLPLLIAELMIGKSTGKSVLTALGNIEYKNKKPFRVVGRISVLLCVLVLSYYSLISGWVLYFAMQFLGAILGVFESSNMSALSLVLNNPYLQVGLISIHLLICIIIVLKGVQEGIEKIIGWTVPVFGFLLVTLVFKTLSLPTAPSALRFLFYPDFSKLTYASLGQAIGQVLFTLSVGFGTMVTFGSYMTNEQIPTAGFRVTIIDMFISIISGLLIFPIALQASNTPLSDPGLLFEVLPKFLVEMPGGVFFGFLFFVSLYLAALGASIGLLEVIVSNWVDRSRIARKTACWSTGLIVFILGLIPVFGNFLHNVKSEHRGILQGIDGWVINWILPVIALCMAFIVTVGLRKKEKEKLFISPNSVATEALYSHWEEAVRWIIPVIIVISILFQIVSLF